MQNSFVLQMRHNSNSEATERDRFLEFLGYQSFIESPSQSKQGSLGLTRSTLTIQKQLQNVRGNCKQKTQKKGEKVGGEITNSMQFGRIDNTGIFFTVGINIAGSFLGGAVTIVGGLI